MRRPRRPRRSSTANAAWVRWPKKDDTTAVLELISSNSFRDESAVIPFINSFRDESAVPFVNSSRDESAAGPRVAPMPRSLLRQRETERPRGDHEPSAPPWAGGPP